MLKNIFKNLNMNQPNIIENFSEVIFLNLIMGGIIPRSRTKMILSIYHFHINYNQFLINSLRKITYNALFILINDC